MTAEELRRDADMRKAVEYMSMHYEAMSPVELARLNAEVKALAAPKTVETGTVVVYHRGDLKPDSEILGISQIEYTDMKGVTDPFFKSEVAMFVEDDGRTKILKNRYGDRGLVIE